MSRELVERAWIGDHGAFERLAAASIDRLYVLARLIVRDPDAAEDATQEALVRDWRDLPTLRDPDHWEAWVRRLLVRASMRRDAAAAVRGFRSSAFHRASRATAA